jgi:hypothetical protein
MKQFILPIALILSIPGVAFAKDVKAPVETAVPKPVEVSRTVPYVEIRVRGPLSPLQMKEIRDGYAKAFPRSDVTARKTEDGGATFVVKPR